MNISKYLIRTLIFIILISGNITACGTKTPKETTMYAHTNHLIHETSPYLLQHAHNPVDWYPWGDEAFAKAKEENKPILLSIGYSSCHWCHVMEHESFENEEIAKIMNDNYISIKVDREERPDIDQVYMTYVQMATGSGGWPMTIVMTPDKKPFFGGTYFPPENRYGRPGFKRILLSMADYYHNQKSKLAQNLGQVDNAYQRLAQRGQELGHIPDRGIIEKAAQQLEKSYEPRFGGIGGAPKFPAVQVFNLFLRQYNLSGDKEYLDMTTYTLQHMAKGGIYDQLGGGFARYSTDARWLVPHFEKMLYDNAQLIQLYLDTYLLTSDSFYLNIAEETLQFVMRDMSAPEGGFYSSYDADSDGKEGTFYVWDKAEIMDSLGTKDGALFCMYFGVTKEGNFEDHNILHVAMPLKDAAEKNDYDLKDAEKVIDSAREKLRLVREKRIHPALDDKIISSWNGLMLSAFARAYQITHKPVYAEVIRKSVKLYKNKIYQDGVLLRTYKDDRAKYHGFIEDYAFMTAGLIDAYEALSDPDMLAWAVELNEKANQHFWDANGAGYFMAADNQEKLLKRMKEESDQSIPSGTGIMALNNLRLFSFTEKADFMDKAENVFKAYGRQFDVNPYGFASFMNALDFYLQKPDEILVAYPSDADVSAYRQLIFNKYRPNKVVMFLPDGVQGPAISASFVAGKTPKDGKITSYVCRNFACSLPQFSVDGLSALLSHPGIGQ